MIEVSPTIQREELNKETKPKLETALAFIYLITGQVILGKTARILQDPEDESSEAWLVLKGLEISPLKDPAGRVVSAAMIPYGAVGGILPPLDQVIFEDFHVMHVIPKVPQSFADDYVRATSSIQIAR